MGERPRELSFAGKRANWAAALISVRESIHYRRRQVLGRCSRLNSSKCAAARLAVSSVKFAYRYVVLAWVWPRMRPTFGKGQSIKVVMLGKQRGV